MNTVTDKNNFLKVGGNKLNYEIINSEWFTPNEPLLVFLHDGLGSIQQWGDFPKSLSNTTGFPALLYDRYGYGKSEKLTKPHELNYFEHEALIVLPEVLKILNIKNKLILIGHSDGGTIALLYAAVFPGNVNCVLTEAAHVFTEDQTLEGIRSTVNKFENGNFKKFLSSYHGNNTESMFYGWSNLWLDKDFNCWNIKGSLQKIKCPVFAIQGDNDKYGSVAHVNLIVNESCGPSECLIIKNCGHIPHNQARDFVLEKMKTFIFKYY